MPEVRRGSRARASSSDRTPPASPQSTGDVTSPLSLRPPPAETGPPASASGSGTLNNEDTTANVAAASLPRRSVTINPKAIRSNSNGLSSRPSLTINSDNLRSNSNGFSSRPSLSRQDTPRKSISYAQRPQEPAYYDSRAATQAEYRRRAHTLQEYYDDNPHLLPQLPFTWHHGTNRWRLGLLIFFMFVDACVVPVALYYGMHYSGHVEGWIIFAIVTTIWGGPTYLEFGIRSLRLVKKERFYRPLNAPSRWSFDLTNWACVITITAVTALFIIGSAPHIVWLRVLCMPAPAILYSLGGVLAVVTLYNVMGWKAPFRISSTAKGEPVLPGAYYFMEDVVAVNAGAGLPYREALAARYKASPRFRRMLYKQSLFWSIPSIILAIPLTVIACIDAVPATAAYGVCWVVPFLWALIWGGISSWWCKKDLVRERIEWESDNASVTSEKPGNTSSEA